MPKKFKKPEKNAFSLKILYMAEKVHFLGYSKAFFIR